MTSHQHSNGRSGHTGEQEPSGRDTAHATNRTLVNRSQVAQETAHTTQHTEAGTPINRSQVAQDTAAAKQRTEWVHQ